MEQENARRVQHEEQLAEKRLKLDYEDLETGDTGTWYCRVDGRSNMVTAYNIKVTGETEVIKQLIVEVLIP